MKQSLQRLWQKIRELVERYPVLVAALVIYLYYLLASFNLFSHNTEKHSWLDYVMEYDSLFFLWLAAAALLQVQRMRKAHKEEEERRHRVERVLDRQQIYTHLVNDITLLLQDNVNNPLAVIAVTTQEIRRRFESDTDILRWLDRIDGAMQRIHNTIRDIQSYEAQKLMDSSKELMEKENTKV
ncbi:MAG: hypothetical protein HY033_12645 [Ignavibacteriae bacterium]|nr:hypothetical protein [Ignavibacteria bacterium]MBI3365742.1 hypothetical protein [Ignavibacteriota bacterium]